MAGRASRDASMCLGATQLSVRLAPVHDSFGSSTNRSIGVASHVLRFLPCYKVTTVSPVPSPLFSWRCLPASTSSFPHAAINLRLPSVTAQPTPLTPKVVAFQPPSMPNARMSLYICSRSTLSPSHPVLSTLHPQGFRTRFAFFGSRPPLIRMGAPAHKKKFSHAQRRLSALLTPGYLEGHGCTESSIRWSGLLRCATMMRSKTRWCTVRSLE